MADVITNNPQPSGGGGKSGMGTGLVVGIIVVVLVLLVLLVFGGAYLPGGIEEPETGQTQGGASDVDQEFNVDTPDEVDVNVEDPTS